jgi:hypothetical protein
MQERDAIWISHSHVRLGMLLRSARRPLFCGVVDFDYALSWVRLHYKAFKGEQ